MILVYFGSESASEFKTFETAARELDRVSSFHVFDAECAKEHSVTTPGLAIFRQFDEPKVIFSEKWDAKEIKHFVLSNYLPTLIEFDREYVQQMFAMKKSSIIFFIPKDQEATSEAFKTF